MKTMFRISLMPNATSLAEKMAVMAAENNGGARQFTLSQIKTVADGNLLEYPSLNKDTTCELIGENLLHLDRKVGENYETVLAIEQVEIMEVPTLSAYENTGGILNPDLHECIN